jgi:hypothetical protein
MTLKVVTMQNWVKKNLPLSLLLQRNATNATTGTFVENVRRSKINPPNRTKVNAQKFAWQKFGNVSKAGNIILVFIGLILLNVTDCNAYGSVADPDDF